MSTPTQPTQSTETEYSRKLREWQLRLAEFMGLDIDALVEIDHTVGDDGRGRVDWRAINQQEPRVGSVEHWHWDFTGVGHDDVATYSAVAQLDRNDAATLREVIGPKPELLTAEERAAKREAMWEKIRESGGYVYDSTGRQVGTIAPDGRIQP